MLKHHIMKETKVLFLQVCDWIPTNMEANQNTIGGIILITVSELCFDKVLCVIHRLENTTHKMPKLPIPIIYHASSI